MSKGNAGDRSWISKGSIAFFLSVLFPCFIGVGVLALNVGQTNVVTAQIREPLSPRPTETFCVDSQNLITLTTAKSSCPLSMRSLGNGPLTESATAAGEVLELHPLLTARFSAAASFAAADGVKLYISSGFRSRERQEILFAEAVRKYGSESEAAKWVLPPQFSHHPQGLAIDVNYPGDKPGALWLEKNGSRFGLCRVYANEWWHFEGVIAPGERCPRLAPNALVDFKAP